ncbi:rhodanese-like domain-containing protein (plasmid) [Verrucomicrobiaceae bacterium 227]
MSLLFETIQTEGIAELSYLLGDDSTGVAAVFDPTPDVEKYLALAREKKVSITHIFETHIHADLVSGSRELCARLGSAKIFLSHEGGANYGFDHEKLMEGDEFTFGETIVTVKHTPGHTPEHVSFLIAAKDHVESPWGVLTGDSLFVDSAGRPDLLGSSETEALTKQLFETLRGFYLSLPDGVAIFPAHGHGSPCGAEIGDRLQSTIGYERKFNSYLQITDYEKFREHALGSAPPVPTYYPRMKKLNARGPDILGNLPQVPGLPPKTFQKAVENKEGMLVDTRTMLAFGGGHIAGALNIGASPMLSVWAGWLLDPDKPLLLVLDSDDNVEEVVKLFLRTGYTNFAGYLVGGMTAWDNAGFPLDNVSQKTVHEIKDPPHPLQIVDVRSPGEWKEGHIPEATHMFLPELREKSAELDKRKPVAVYCASGYRASIASSILKQENFDCVSSVPGSWQAWKNAKFPIQRDES